MKSKNNTNNVTPPDCVHEFIIDTPKGKYSNGKCRKCNEIRRFANSFTTYTWKDSNKATLRKKDESAKR